ncbi:MAG: hypothetical protein ACFHWZ_01255 [Phycisphaerales bacterium]
MSSEAGHDTPNRDQTRSVFRSRPVRAGIALTALMLGSMAGGCLRETDGWLWDPSVVGRWEHTPTVVPVLDRIDIIEAGMLETVDVTDVRRKTCRSRRRSTGLARAMCWSSRSLTSSSREHRRSLRRSSIGLAR